MVIRETLAGTRYQILARARVLLSDLPNHFPARRLCSFLAPSPLVLEDGHLKRIRNTLATACCSSPKN